MANEVNPGVLPDWVQPFITQNLQQLLDGALPANSLQARWNNLPFIPIRINLQLLGLGNQSVNLSLNANALLSGPSGTNDNENEAMDGSTSIKVYTKIKFKFQNALQLKFTTYVGYLSKLMSLIPS
jgi:hypothetical protein